MSQSNPNIPIPSQETESKGDSITNPSQISTDMSESCGNLEVSESESVQKNKSNGSAPAVSKIARPTGLKLPAAGSTTSRIARLCNYTPKPTTPTNPSATPRSGGEIASAEVSRGKTIDKWAIKRLMDVNEADENEVPSSSGEKWTAERKMSSGSVLSDSNRVSTPDDLRKLRLSDVSYSPDSLSDYWKSDDADPNRSSDANIVLTENTDQFIIGDRVWVGGVKPGQIAYIGETQFAPGDWAGIVLDEPIGKNDGTVANIRYFQCEPKKGIFSRLTRLTKHPLADGGAGEPIATKPLPSETKRSNGSLSGSVPRKSPLVLTPTSGVKSSISKPSSPDSGVLASPSLVVGDRVIIKSSQGSKAGILRYIGTTEFAPGEWCGVELDDPLGKNDGSVAGTRYFECQPKFGLFAPLHKVSRSPANKRLFQPCMVHPNRTSLRRQGSKESLVSMSSAASTAASVRSTTRKIGAKTPTPSATTTRTTLQETLKKKEQQIEQLLKERDLERAEMTRAANQADEAERQLACMKKEFEKYKKEVDAHMAEMDAALCLLKSEKTNLLSQLDDEKKKYEDLQFRFEEETIDKADIRSTVAQYEEKLNLIQKTLADERKRAENLESDSNKLFEAEEQMVIVKDELDSTKEELETHKRLRSTLEQKHISLEAHLTAARAEIESLKIENQSLKETVSKDENTMKESLAESIRKLEETKRDLESKQKLVEELSVQLKAKDESSREKEKELETKYSKIIQELTEKHKVETSRLSQDLNSSWETKLKVLENQIEDKIKEGKILEEKIEEANIALSKNKAEKTAEHERNCQAEAQLQKELKGYIEELEKKNQLLNELTTKSDKHMEEAEKFRSELENTKMMLSTESESTSKQFETLNSLIKQQTIELETLKTEIQSKSEELKSLKESGAATARDYEEKINKLNDVLRENNDELKNSKEKLAKAEKEFEIKYNENKSLNESLVESLKTKIREMEDSEKEQRSDLERLNRDLETSRNSLEARENELKNEQNTSKNLAEKLLALEENYRKISEEKDRIELEAGDAGRKLQSTEEKLNQVLNQKSKLEEDISTFINSSNDSSVQLAKLNEDLRMKEKEMDSLREEMSRNNGQFERVEQELKQQLEKMKENLINVKNEREKENEFHGEEIKRLKEKLENSLGALKKAEDEWKEKMNETTNLAQTKIKDLEEKVKIFENKNAEDEKQHEKHIREVLKAQKDLEEKLENARKAGEETRKGLESKIEELTVERTNLLEAVEKTKIDLLTSEKNLEEKAKLDAASHATECEKLKNELKEITERLVRTSEELTAAKDEKNKLAENKSELEKIKSEIEIRLKSTEAKNSELTVDISSVQSENQILKETIDRLRKEKCSLEKENSDKMMAVTELNMRVKSLENARETGEAETEVKLKNLESEISDLKSSLEKTEALRAGENTEKNKTIENLGREIQKFKEESSQKMAEKEKEMENVKGIASEMRKELNDSKRECDKKAETIEKLEKNLESMREALNDEKKRREDVENRYEKSGKEIDRLKEKFENQSKILENSSNLGEKLGEMNKKLEESKIREQELVKNSKSEREALLNLLETTKMLLTQQETETKKYATEVESLKLEKIKLIEKLEELPKNHQTQDEKPKPVLDEPDLEKGQIDFLNSVIVDMQKKNDALKARIEILEMGYSPEDVEEFNLHNINARSVAPRLFCDICDRFDLHDTEDCPTQAGDDEPPPKSSKSKAPPPPRPYCDICEIFGHYTADCDDAETF